MTFLPPHKSRLALPIAAFLFLLAEIALVAFCDRPVSEFLRGVDARHPALIDFFRAWTDLGKSAWYLWPSALGMIACAVPYCLDGKAGLPRLSLKVRRTLARTGEGLALIFFSVAVSGVLADTIKPLVGRARPVMMVREGLYGFHPLSFEAAWHSMPSGHATTAFALAGALAALFPRARIAWYLAAVCLAASRVMVNAHFPSDIAAGAVVGYATAGFFARAFARDGIFPYLKRFFPIDSPPSRS